MTLLQEKSQNFFHLQSGVGIYLERCQRSILHNGKLILAEGEEYSQIYFNPDGNTTKNSKEITATIIHGIEGIIELISAIEKGHVKLPHTFLGITNKEMALIVQRRLGFVIIEELEPESWESYTVIGKLEDIKPKLDQIIQSGVLDRLKSRQARITKLQNNSE
ncbi:MAG: hypothetical protein NZM26_01530 [Patescibacteria group bacterium]|nr:hypothetical protein [Patescibacteria group bacterium]